MPANQLELFQYSPPDGQWTSIPGFEGDVAADFWEEIFDPASVCWWAVGWQGGQVVYYSWQSVNACSGEVMVPGMVGQLPGPPGVQGPVGPQGPAGQPGAITHQYTYVTGRLSTSAGLAGSPTYTTPTNLVVNPNTMVVPVTQQIQIPANTKVTLRGWVVLYYVPDATGATCAVNFGIGFIDTSNNVTNGGFGGTASTYSGGPGFQGPGDTVPISYVTIPVGGDFFFTNPITGAFNLINLTQQVSPTSARLINSTITLNLGGITQDQVPV